MEAWNQGKPVRAGGRREKNMPMMMEVWNRGKPVDGGRGGRTQDGRRMIP